MLKKKIEIDFKFSFFLIFLIFLFPCWFFFFIFGCENNYQISSIAFVVPFLINFTLMNIVRYIFNVHLFFSIFLSKPFTLTLNEETLIFKFLWVIQKQKNKETL